MRTHVCRRSTKVSSVVRNSWITRSLAVAGSVESSQGARSTPGHGAGGVESVVTSGSWCIRRTCNLLLDEHRIKRKGWMMQTFKLDFRGV